MNLKLEQHDLDRILFLSKKIINGREDIIEVGDIVLTSLKREVFAQ
jgi:hypothetical protein